MRSFYIKAIVLIAALAASAVFLYLRDPTCANPLFASMNAFCHYPQ